MSRGGTGRRSVQTKSPPRTGVVGAILAVIVVGIAPIAWDPWGLQAFLHTKLLLAGIGLSLGFWATRRTGLVLPSSRTVRVSLALLLLVASASTVLATAPWVALLGAASRQFGLVMWFTHAAFFVIGLSVFRHNHIDGLRWAAVGASIGLVVSSVFGLLEAVGASPFDYSQSFGDRVQGVFGNPAELGAYTVLALPLSIALVVDGAEPWMRRLGLLASVGAIPVLVLSGSRGAWIGAIVGVGLAAWAMMSRGRLTRRSFLALAAAAAVIVVATLPTGRWTTVTEAIEGRVDLWAVGVTSIAANPVVGLGPEGFADDFGQHVSEGFVVEYSREQVYDRVHNDLLDVGVATGFLGLLGYLLVLGSLTVVTWRGLHHREVLVLGAAIGVVAYVVQLQLFFQIPTVGAAFWLMCGMLASATVAITPLRTTQHKMALASVGGIATLISVYAALGLVADHLDKQAIAAAPSTESLDALEAAARIRPVDNTHYILAAGIAREIPEATAVERALELVRAGRSHNPVDSTLLLGEVNLLNQLFRLTGDETQLQAGDRMLLAALQRDPTNGEIHLRLGTSAYYRRDLVAAETNWLRAEVLLPNSDAPRANLNILDEELDR